MTVTKNKFIAARIISINADSLSCAEGVSWLNTNEQNISNSVTYNNISKL